MIDKILYNHLLWLAQLALCIPLPLQDNQEVSATRYDFYAGFLYL